MILCIFSYGHSRVLSPTFTCVLCCIYVLWYRLFVKSHHFMYLFSKYGGCNKYYYIIILSPYCVTMCWVTVITLMAIPTSPTHLWEEITGDRWFSQKYQWCGAFVFALLLFWIICWTNSWVTQGWRRCDAISLYCLLVIFKMLSGPMGEFCKIFLKC